MQLQMLPPKTLIHEILPGLQTWERSRVEGYLTKIAEALMAGWGDQLQDICDYTRYRRKGTPAQNAIIRVTKDFQAKENYEGIRKTCVLVNHQWVVKLGHSAVEEMELYENVYDDFLDQLVPTVWLSDIGCVQLKVDIPELCDLGRGYFFEEEKEEIEYQNMLSQTRISDIHRGNVGIWQGRMVAIDFEGGISASGATITDYSEN